MATLTSHSDSIGALNNQVDTSCVSSITGKPKAKYESASICGSFMRKAQRTNPVLLGTYKCKSCGFYHFGKTKTLYAHYVKQKQKVATEERLVGKLIGALKGVING